jgi:cytochrome oxidase Cu insertion factor (SCO1/SenC/PrrC family)
MRKILVLAGLLLAPPGASAQHAAQELDFVPPAPGTYKLQHILRAPEGTVLDGEGDAKRFSRFTTGRITVLSLIYTRCGDGRGCPLASYMLKALKGRIDQRRGWSDLLRFVSLSFDPDHDTPAVMRAYGSGYAPDKVGLPWHFLTTRSHSALRPLLDGFGQDVWMPTDPSADATGPLPHVLKVFLIDRRGSVREIYTTSFLQPQMVLNDIQTLLLEEGPATSRRAR